MKRRTQQIFSSAKIVFAFGFFSLLCSPVVGQPPANVVVTNVLERPVAAGQTFVGTTTPIKKSMVGSAVDGRIASYPINEGDFVKKGAPLAQLLTATITLELSAARSEMKLREAELKEIVNGSRPEEVRQSQSELLAAETAMEYQKKKLKRAQELYESSAVNADELQLIVSEQIQSEQVYLQAKEKHQLVLQGPRKEKIEQAQAQLAIQKSEVQKLEDRLVKHTIKAPFDGYISAEHTEVGQWVQRGELVAEVLAMNEMDILTQVPESVIPFVKKGMEVKVHIAALPNRIFIGEVAIIVPQADIRSRTFPVKIRVKNEFAESIPIIKSGQMARVTLPTGSKKNSLLVPKDALVLGGRSPLVYVIGPGKEKKSIVAMPVPVETGVAQGELIQIFGNIKANQQVVIRGNERLRPGLPVNILPSSSN